MGRSRRSGSPDTAFRVPELLAQFRSGVPRAYLIRLAAQSPVNGSVTIVVALLIAAFLLSQRFSVAILVWLVLQLTVGAWVLTRLRAPSEPPQPLPETRRSRRGLYRALAWAIVSGSLWGALTGFLPAAPTHVQIVLILTMGGLAAGATATLAAVPQVAAVFILGCTVPVTLYYLSVGGEGITLALVFAVFTVAMIATSQVVFSALSRQFNAEWHAQQLEAMGAALRESEQRFRATFQNAAVGIAHVGTDRSWLHVNDRVCDIVGYSREELTARTLDDLTHPDDVAADAGLFDAMLRGERSGYQVEERYLRKDGRVVWVLLTNALQRDDLGQPMYSICVIQDITARKLAEEALRDSDRAKDEFLAFLGHELRNPLAPLRTGLEILQQAPRNPELLENLLPVMNRQLSHLVRLVDDLLDISRISRGVIELQLAALDVKAPIQAAIEQVRSLVDERRHQLRVNLSDEPMQVMGDLERLTQVFANLLGNAAKFMDPGGTIRVTSESRHGEAVVRVRDVGYGIAPERIDTLFTLFSRFPEHRERAGGGLGIGLALSRRLIEMHGGSLEAESAGLGHGSEFIVHLPMSGPVAEETPGDLTAIPAVAAHRVLIVDDNADAVQGLKTLLEMNGQITEIACDGRTALAQIEAFEPDVVLLDLGLPDMDGVEVARRARELARGRAMRLVAVTGRGQDQDRQQTREAGFDLHLTKPVEWQQLATLLAERGEGAPG